MRNSFKKLLSIMLAVVMLTCALGVTLTAFAAESYALTFETNGGTWAEGYTVPTEYTYNQWDFIALPNYEKLTKDGAVFGGWYDNAELSGSPIYAIPAASTGAKTYYAYWFKTQKLIDNFDSSTGSPSDWTAWIQRNQSKAYEAHSLNTDSAKSYSGNNSMKLLTQNINDGNHNGADNQYAVLGRYLSPKLTINDGEGLYFWIDTKIGTTLELKLNADWHTRWGSTPGVINVPAGKSLILIPWSAYSSAGITAETQIDPITLVVKGAWNNTGEMYFDDIGTFETVPYIEPVEVNLETNGGTLTNPDAEYEVGDALPTFEGVSKADCIFDGWFKNADFSGDKALTVEDGATYYAKWLKVVDTLNDFEAATDTSKGIYGWTNAGRGTYTTEINTDAAYASSGTKSAKLTTKYGNNAKEDGLTNDWMRWGAWATYLEYHNDDAADGISFWVNSAYETTLKIYSNCSTADSTSGGVESAVKTIPAGKSYVTFTWEELGATKPWNIVIMPFCVWNFRNDIYVDDIATYDDPTIYEPSYGVTTPAKGGMFAAGDAGANEAAGIDNITGAIYEVGGVKYTAFRVFGTYIAPNDESTAVPAPDYGKIVVDANGTTEVIESRHVMLGYGAEPDVNNHYAMSTVTEDFDKCWSAEQLDDGSWRVTYSLLLKGIPEAHAATSFYAGSAVVTANGTYAGNSINNVSAQVMYEAMGDTTITWFTNAQ